MKIITLWQPWASLIALNLKHYETRSWSTNYRGPLLIHAAKRCMSDRDGTLTRIAFALNRSYPEKSCETWMHEICSFRLGVVVAIANLNDCREMVDVVTRRCHLHPCLQIDSSAQSKLEQAVGDWTEFRHAWKLTNVQRLVKPIPWRGSQGLRDAPPELQSLVKAAANSQAERERAEQLTLLGGAIDG